MGRRRPRRRAGRRRLHVSLLIAGLAFDQPALADSVGAAVLIASTAAAVVAVALLRRRPTVDERAHRSRQP